MYFFLLILGVFFNLIPDAIYKCGRFSKTFLEKSFKFILYKGVGFVSLSSSLILLPLKINPLTKEEACKKYAFIAFSFSRFEIVPIFPAKVVVFHV